MINIYQQFKEFQTFFYNEQKATTANFLNFIFHLELNFDTVKLDGLTAQLFFLSSRFSRFFFDWKVKTF